MIQRRWVKSSRKKTFRFKLQNFWDEKDLDKELRRQFDVCHSCRRCFNLCDSFPKLFDLIDDSETMELFYCKFKKF